MTIIRSSWGLSWVTGAVAAVTLSTGALAAEPIYTGGEAGSYFGSFGPLAVEVLRKEFFEYEVRTSAGSGENIQQVLRNPRAIGMTQTDVLAYQASQNPTISEQITIIRNDVANECLYAVTTESNAERLGNWGSVTGYARRLRFAMGSEASGSAQTFKLLQSFDENLAQASKVEYMGSTDDAIDAVINGAADIAFFVQFPDPSNARFERLNDAKMVFVPVINRTILRQRFADGERAYVPLEIKVTSAGLLNWQGVEKIVTACTPLAYITGKPDLVTAGSDARLDHEEMIEVLRAAPLGDLQPRAGWFQSMLDDLVEVSEQGLEKALQAVDDAAQSVAQ
ncbi:TAXI family TRAP transporter solute-binding subunit [Roseospira visakhapatnamensis]|uniref:TRAP-type uncharacterized transport system substrate-binding protein n=1 Tax=Roseospira visakhapatnamensis TaxID=390880 RepID=A0A7W6RD20_9PROT|nr:TAXI family TRAP transporter solute-binding subunit [Roseospira visakhapatnamensis]MBB4266336.1 TRAP-type uncharacterized transport system substrate-binding protein [Roseospira visakhapatnamensis]